MSCIRSVSVSWPELWLTAPQLPVPLVDQPDQCWPVRLGCPAVRLASTLNGVTVRHRIATVTQRMTLLSQRAALSLGELTFRHSSSALPVLRADRLAARSR